MRQLSRFDKRDIITIEGYLNIMVSDPPDFIIKNRKQLQYLPTNCEIGAIGSTCCNEDIKVNQLGK